MAVLLAPPPLGLGIGILHLRPSFSCSRLRQQQQQQLPRRRSQSFRWRTWAQPAAAAPLDSEQECELVSGIDLTLEGDQSEEDDGQVNAHLVKAVKNNNGHGVVLLSDVLGFSSPETKDFAYRLACFGYNVLIPDLFRGDPWNKEGEFEEWRAKQPPQRVAKDIDMSSKWLMAQLGGSSKLGLIGFCYGGGRALETLARNSEAFSAAVCFYGTRFEESLGAEISVPLLFILGDKDTLCPVQVVEETRGRSKQQHEFVVKVYPGRGHAFAHRPQSAEEDEDADDAFSTMQFWLQQHL